MKKSWSSHNLPIPCAISLSNLQARGLQAVEGVTGDSADPTELAWRFSPVSNNKRDKISPANELRVLVATDVLSEGQNLQDAAIVVNYDLPWAIIRLIQRAGRVDRIGQQSDTIYCYSFLPAEGVERLIRLRERVLQRLKQNAEVVGTDEAFFEDEFTDSTKSTFLISTMRKLVSWMERLIAKLTLPLKRIRSGRMLLMPIQD